MPALPEKGGVRRKPPKRKKRGARKSCQEGNPRRPEVLSPKDKEAGAAKQEGVAEVQKKKVVRR